MDETVLSKRKAVREGVERARGLALAAVGAWALVGGLLLVSRWRRVKPPPPPTAAEGSDRDLRGRRPLEPPSCVSSCLS